MDPIVSDGCISLVKGPPRVSSENKESKAFPNGLTSYFSFNFILFPLLWVNYDLYFAHLVPN